MENMLTYISKNLYMNGIFESVHLSLRYENLNSYEFQNPPGITALMEEGNSVVPLILCKSFQKKVGKAGIAYSKQNVAFLFMTHEI